ncbi:MAG: EpsG family protein [Bacteroidaceae bacterium]|nr:EpsG family protein [Bacteroidaceae bacterium]
MWIYLLIFLVALLGVSNTKLTRSTGYLACFFIFLALFVGLGDMLGGYDRYIYTDLFDGAYNVRIRDISVKETTLWGYKTEYGYVFLNYLISFITANRYIFILILTCLIYAMMYQSFKEYMDSYPIAIVLFLALMFFFTFTYLREITGVCFGWFAVRYAYRRKPILFFLFAYIAYICHNSAAILFPFYFLPAYKWRKSFVVLAMFVIFCIGLTPFPTSLFKAYSEVIDDGGRSASYQGDYDAGHFRLEYLIEAAFFMYLILINYDKIPNTRKNLMMLNSAIVFCAVITFFVRSSNGGRLGWYYAIGVISTMTTILTQRGVRSQLRPFLLIVCFFLYFRILNGWGMLLSPYKSFLTDGHREGDYIFEYYEYDLRYDEDKFYRPPFVLFKSKEELLREEL